MDLVQKHHGFARTILPTGQDGHGSVYSQADLRGNLVAAANNRTGLGRTFGIGAPRTAVVTVGTRF
jgi:hypothetical protein